VGVLIYSGIGADRPELVLDLATQMGTVSVVAMPNAQRHRLASLCTKPQGLRQWPKHCVAMTWTGAWTVLPTISRLVI
jgi:hypothetical protein